MKRTIILIVLMGVIGGVIWFNSTKDESTINYQAVETHSTTTVEVDVLQNRIDVALANAEDTIQATAQAAYDDAREQAELEIELEVTAQIRAELETREVDIEEKLSF